MDINGKPFLRSRTDKMLGGVCGGLAKCYGKDALLLSLLAYNVGAGRIPGTKTQRKSQLLRKIESGDRNDIQEYLSFCHYKSKILRGTSQKEEGGVSAVLSSLIFKESSL